MSRPIPLAIGLIHAQPDATPSTRSRARVRMGAFAFREGYALAETFEMSGQAVKDDATYRAMTQLAARCSIRTLLAADDVSSTWVAEVWGAGVLAVMLVPRALINPTPQRSVQAWTASGEAVSQTRSKLAR